MAPPVMTIVFTHFFTSLILLDTVTAGVGRTRNTRKRLRPQKVPPNASPPVCQTQASAARTCSVSGKAGELRTVKPSKLEGQSSSANFQKKMQVLCCGPPFALSDLTSAPRESSRGARGACRKVTLGRGRGHLAGGPQAGNQGNSGLSRNTRISKFSSFRRIRKRSN